jgi:ABC-2 type transport system permease protein
MKRGIRLFLAAARSNIAARLAYRTNSLGGMAISIISEMLLPLMTVLVYSAGTSFPGWSLEEALLLQGILIMSRGAGYMLFMSMPYTVMNAVREGTFDLVMIRPVPAAFLSMMLSLSLEDISIFLSGAAVFLVSAVRLHLAPAFGPSAWMAVLFLTGLAVMFGFALLMSATMFKWVGNSRIGEIYESIAGFGRYPTQVFPGIFRTLITYILPVALLGSLPAEVFLGKLDPVPLEMLVILICSGGFLLAAYAVWHLMIRQYSSSGG